MAATKLPGLKPIPAGIDRELAGSLTAIQEALAVRLGQRGDPKDRAVTLRELIDSGLATDLAQSPYNPNTGASGFGPFWEGPANVIVPPAPTSLTADGVFTKVLLAWNQSTNAAPYRNHAFTEIWRSQAEDLSSAVLVGTTNAFIYTDEGVDYGSTHYYWVRFVSDTNTPGPYSNMASGTTIENIAATMAALSEELQNLPGYTALTTLITNADVAVAATAAVAARVIRSSSAPTTREDSSALTLNDIWFDTDDGQVYTRNAANNAWVAGRDSTLVSLYGATSYTGSTITSAMASAQADIITVTSAQSSTAASLSSLSTTVTNNNNTLTSAITTEASSRTTGDQTNATAITNLTSTVTSNNNTLTSAINSEATTRANADTALATDITSLTSTVTNNNNTLTSAINTEATTRATADSTNATNISNLTSTINNGSTGLAAAHSAISSEATTRAAADTANALSISNLSTTVGTTNSNVSTLQTSVSNLEGDADAMYVIQVATESNGSKSAAGMVIGSNANSGSGAQSYVQFRADKFAVWSGSASVAPFIISSGVVYIDDARIKDGAITNARIANGTIETAKIGDAQITTAKIANLQVTNALIADATIEDAKINTLNATKINAGLINSLRINVDTLNVKHFDNVSTDIKSHTGSFVPLAVFGSSFQRASTDFTTQTQTTGTYLSTTIGNVRNGAQYQAIWTGVYGDCTDGVLEYSVNGSTYVQAAGGIQNVTMAAGTFRTYVFAYSGTISGLSSSSNTVYWRVRWITKLRSTYQSLYVFIDNTQ
jgi:hypothetical protein